MNFLKKKKSLICGPLQAKVCQLLLGFQLDANYRMGSMGAGLVGVLEVSDWKYDAWSQPSAVKNPKISIMWKSMNIIIDII